MGSSEKSGERIPMTASMSQQPVHYQPVMGIPLDSAYNYAVPTAPSLGGQIQNASPTKWSTGLCSCSKNVGNCCLTCWCPCITFGRIAEITDRGATTCETGGAIYALLMLAGFSCFYSCCYRSKLRSQYSLVETPCPDFLVHCCCESCALCQEYRELEGRGFDMSAGWYGNVQRQTRGVTTIATTAPMMPGAMSR